MKPHVRETILRMLEESETDQWRPGLSAEQISVSGEIALTSVRRALWELKREGILGITSVSNNSDMRGRNRYIWRLQKQEPKPTRRPGPKRPSRQPDPLLRRKVENAAVEATIAHFEGKGFTVDSCEKDNVGWDLTATLGKRTLLLEVKGLAGCDLCVELTPNEYEQMQAKRLTYCICIVSEALTSPTLAVFPYRGGKWVDDRNRLLAITEVVAARCFVR